MKATILIKLKDEVLDAPGRALTERLVNQGFSEVNSAKVGKLIELDIESADRENTMERIKQMCDKLLANNVIEEFEVHSIE